ncbi:MAG: hypothetical protein QXF12_06140 [Candidatus Aenigmatarchaeota archaeon]
MYKLPVRDFLNISEHFFEFIKNNYDSYTSIKLFESLSIMEMFGLKNYEDVFSNIIVSYDSISQDDKRDLVYFKVKEILTDMIGCFGITLRENLYDLRILNDILYGLYLIENLEDYRDLIAILSDMESSPKEKLSEIYDFYCLMSLSDFYENVYSVEEGLIGFLYQKADENVRRKDLSLHDHRLRTVKFFEYIKDSEYKPYAYNLYVESIYKGLKFNELYDLIDSKFHDIVYNLIDEKKYHLVSFEILSIIMYSTNGSESPLGIFDSNFNEFFYDDLLLRSKIREIILDMLNDFETYLRGTYEES